MSFGPLLPGGRYARSVHLAAPAGDFHGFQIDGSKDFMRFFKWFRAEGRALTSLQFVLRGLLEPRVFFGMFCPTVNPYRRLITLWVFRIESPRALSGVASCDHPFFLPAAGAEVVKLFSRSTRFRSLPNYSYYPSQSGGAHTQEYMVVSMAGAS